MGKICIVLRLVLALIALIVSVGSLMHLVSTLDTGKSYGFWAMVTLGYTWLFTETVISVSDRVEELFCLKEKDNA